MLWYIGPVTGDCAPLGIGIQTRIRICQDPPLRHARYIQLYAYHTTLRPSIAPCRSHGILTVCPSGAAFAIPLGPTNPWLIYIAKETLIFRRAGISPALRLLVPTFLLRNAPVWVTPSPSTQMRILSYRLCTSLRRRWGMTLRYIMTERWGNPVAKRHFQKCLEFRALHGFEPWHPPLGSRANRYTIARAKSK